MSGQLETPLWIESGRWQRKTGSLLLRRLSNYIDGTNAPLTANQVTLYGEATGHILYAALKVEAAFANQHGKDVVLSNTAALAGGRNRNRCLNAPNTAANQQQAFSDDA